jgi:4-alpha-glucanotransferase
MARTHDGAADGKLLKQLAQLYGVQSSYVDLAKRRQHASKDTVLAVLGELGADVEHPEDAVRQALRDRWTRMLEPVVVAWDGRAADIAIRLPERSASAKIAWSVEVQNGEPEAWSPPKRADDVRATTMLDGKAFVERRFDLPLRLPPGYHQLHVQAGPHQARALVISAPRKAPQPHGRRWGVFLPLFSLVTERSWGTADLTDLRHLLEWTAARGGSLVATLPLLAAFLDQPFEPSPYSPASRLFWNELYLDVEALPELERSPTARRRLRAERFARQREESRRGDLVDYRAAMALKRRILEPLAGTFFEDPDSRRRRDFERYLRDHPNALDYARFRANVERRREPWGEWPRAERDGRLPAQDKDASNYHLYVQWQMERQLESTASVAREKGAGLYFDLPAGVHPSGYDAWRERAAFARNVSAGAPPDTFFTGGQVWGFPPLHPERIREQGYRHPIQVLRTVLAHADVLRIDHVMGLHRMFWVPQGLEAKDGAYVRYRSDELFAIACLEADRANAVIVGEDLGTVSPLVRGQMRRHGLLRSYVLQIDAGPDAARPIRVPPRDALASTNTHDLPTFAAWWRGLDVGQRLRLGWLDEEKAERERAGRAKTRAAIVRALRDEGRLTADQTPDERAIFRAATAHLAATDTRFVTVNLEDCWAELRPQNTPGTIDGQNWRRRARVPFERFRALPTVLGTLQAVDEARKEHP